MSMMFFFNYEESEVVVLPPERLTRHGKAVDVYTFGPGMISLMGIQAGTLKVKWATAFEEETTNPSGVPNGEVLGPPRGSFTLEGLWVRDPVLAPNDQIRMLVGLAFQHKEVTYRVKEVEHTGTARDFLKASLTGTAMLGVDGNTGGGLTLVGGVLSDGPEGGPSVDIYGVWTATRTLRKAVPVMPDSLPALGSDHPRFTWMKCQGTGDVRVARGYCELSALYKGIPDRLGPERGRLEKTTSAEPLQSHPRYASLDNLDRIVDVIEAVRRGDLRLGIFPGDDIPDVMLAGLALELLQKMMRGQEEYLACGQTWTTVQYSMDAFEEARNPGSINTPTGAPSYGDRTWLYTGLVVSDEGPSLYRGERTWLLSAPGGWDATIYG